MACAAFEVEEEEQECLPTAAAPVATQQECVLLIEDSEEAMFLVRHVLEEYGNGRYSLKWASNLGAGLDHLSGGGVDVVLLDLGLPESSGPQSYAWVREIAPRVPVVVLTGDDRMETEFAVVASGVESYLVKNHISGSDLLDAIRSALVKEGNRSRDSSHKPFRIK